MRRERSCCLRRAPFKFIWLATRAALSDSLSFPCLLRSALQLLQWTRDWKRAQELSWLVATAYGQLLTEVEGPLPGVVDWLTLMSKNNVPCALVSACMSFLLE